MSSKSVLIRTQHGHRNTDGKRVLLRKCVLVRTRRRTMGQRITERFIKSLEQPTAGNRVYYDTDIVGFGARITAAGVVSFVLNYYARGRERRYTIGRYPELNATAAREEALAIREIIRGGGDPMERKE